MVTRNWKTYTPGSLPDAIRACKDFALDKNKQLSVLRICTLLATNEDTLYKWMSTGRMPATVIPQYELICGCHFVSDFLATNAGRLVIPMPKGRKATDADLLQLASDGTAVAKTLGEFYANPSQVDTAELVGKLTRHIEQVAFHHGNVQRYQQPELEGLEA